MTWQAQQMDRPGRGDVIVRAPRVTDALGHALRGVYADATLPADMLMLLRRLDRVAH